MKIKITIYFFVLLIIGSCSFFDGFDEIPMFLNVDNIDLNTTNEQGANTHGINDISVYADGFNIGVFNLPASIPVLDDDATTNITVRPVVRINGQQDIPVEFPFYEGQEFDFDFQPDAQIEIDPVFKYRSDVRFIFKENFEGQHRLRLDIDGSDSTSITKSTDARSGMFSGIISATDETPFFEKAGLDVYPVSDVENSLIYLEMDYKCEIEFRVGIIGYRGNTASREYKIVLIPSDDWKKLYLDISPEILSNNFDQYQLIFSSLPGSLSKGSVQFDNIKIISF